MGTKSHVSFALAVVSADSRSAASMKGTAVFARLPQLVVFVEATRSLCHKEYSRETVSLLYMFEAQRAALFDQ